MHNEFTAVIAPVPEGGYAAYYPITSIVMGY